MSTLESYWDALPHREDVAHFDREKSRAFLDLLIAMALADAEVTALERLGFAQALLSLPHFDTGEWKVFESREAVRIVAEMKERLDVDESGTLAELVSAFEPGEERVFLFSAVIRFTTPDGWAEPEHAFAKRLGTAMGFDDGQRDELIANALLRPEHHDE